MTCYIVACGEAFPERTVPNGELAVLLGVSPEWIEANCGIRERRWVSAKQSASDLAAVALRNALTDSKIDPQKIDYLIGCTLSPDYQVPGIAPIVQRKVPGLRRIPAADLRVGCAAVLYCMQLARGLIESGAANTVACFGAEAQSKGLRLSPETAELSMLFGDGAGAMVISLEPIPGSLALRIDDVLIETDGAFAEDLCVRAPGTANGPNWIDDEQVAAGLQLGSMNGRVLILQAVRKLEEAARRITARNGMGVHDVDVIVPHQANGNLLRSLAKRLSVPEDRIVLNLDRYGNTSSASAFITLYQAVAEERLHSGSKVLFLAFGAGFTWGAALCSVSCLACNTNTRWPRCARNP
jgi:3-oxoacyl-[acyl-carrier-protein] synthase-3